MSHSVSIFTYNLVEWLFVSTIYTVVQDEFVNITTIAKNSAFRNAIFRSSYFETFSTLIPALNYNKKMHSNTF